MSDESSACDREAVVCTFEEQRPGRALYRKSGAKRTVRRFPGAANQTPVHPRGSAIPPSCPFFLHAEISTREGAMHGMTTIVAIFLPALGRWVL